MGGEHVSMPTVSVYRKLQMQPVWLFKYQFAHIALSSPDKINHSQGILL
jgi:hypothetical protein